VVMVRESRKRSRLLANSAWVAVSRGCGRDSDIAGGLQEVGRGGEAAEGDGGGGGG
jgi:hypothetical protein